MKATLNLNLYIEYLKSLSSNDIKDIYKSFHDYCYGKYNEKGFKLLSSEFNNIFIKSAFDEKYTINFKLFDKLKIVNDYVVNNNFYWTVLNVFDEYVIIKYSNNLLFVFKKYISIIFEETFNNLTLDEIKTRLLGDKYAKNEMSLSNTNDISISQINDKRKNINDKIKALNNEIENVNHNKTKELAKLQAEIDKKLVELNDKKEKMMIELNSKMNEFNKMLDALKKQIYALKVDIYSIRCFAGDTIELIKLRDGNIEKEDVPLVINQKILYLDEDLAKVLSIYNDDISRNYKLLEEALKYNDTCVELFCPQSKCITFFRCSKSSKQYYNNEDDILTYYNMLHGNKMGFIVKNGESLYVGWMEEEWDDDTTDADSHILTFHDSVVYKPEYKIINENDCDNKNDTSLEEMVSRLFAINIIQGLISNKNILNLPNNVKIFDDSPYIIFNYADAWLSDNRYGDFSTLVNNLNYYNHVGDTILIIKNTKETNYENYGGNRSRGERNNTRDCVVNSGLNTINLIENKTIYVSAKRDTWYETKNNANYEIDEDEYINLTFMNSLWLEYFINTKAIGQFGYCKNENGYGSSNLSYSYLIKYFKIAFQYLKEREVNEYDLISKYVILENYNDWLDLLSHWKIYNKVRFITDYQAKRFAKYLLNKKYLKIKHLFENDPKFEFLSIHDYFETDVYPFSREHRWSLTNKYNLKFSWNNNSETDVDMHFNKNSNAEDIKNRELLDFEKIEFIKNKLFEFCDLNNIDIYSDMFKKIYFKFIEDSRLGDLYKHIFEKFIISNNNINDIYINVANALANDHYYNNYSPSLIKIISLYLIQAKVFKFMVETINYMLIYNYKYEINNV